MPSLGGTARRAGHHAARRSAGTAARRTPARAGKAAWCAPRERRAAARRRGAARRRRRHERRLTGPAALRQLSRAYAARGGAPVIAAVDAGIFRRRYFGHCLACGFCGDACCQHGVDVSVQERDRILARADELERATGTARESWFVAGETVDPDFAGGSATRTAVADGACVFLQRGARGCALHAFALREGMDYHDLKPMVSALFPVTFGGGALLCSEELVDGSLVCAGEGPSAYEMARAELEYYFGGALVSELDELAANEPSGVISPRC